MVLFFPLLGALQKPLKDDQNKEDKTIVVSGKKTFKKLIKAFYEKIARYHLEFLCCEGCIVGPGIREKNKEFSKYIRIQEYASKKLQNLSLSSWQEFPISARN
jgi:iron only hydrogenase large subunit-like protein